MTPATGRQRFVRSVYADQNDSPAVRTALGRLLQDLGQGRGVNVGGGPRRLDDRLIHVDLVRHPACDCAADARRLPFASGVFDLAVSQETVEHVDDPFLAVREIVRVVRPGGKIYLQVPFVIGYHPGPEDYWRFTRAGVAALLRQAGIPEARIAIAVGPGSGFYRIGVEFLAGLVGRVVPALYRPAKGAAALLCYPVKWLDGWLAGGAQRDRIAGGYLAVATKPDGSD
ncbi:MAG TPA: class I SAM-dependent methyltransferase [Anaerolineales bacterium]|nr:class I SAM-dependent methyltransferase [Anaerolineales bacterium]